MADLPDSILKYTQNDLEESMFRSLTVARLSELDKSLALCLQLMQTLSHLMLVDNVKPPGYDNLMRDIDEFLSKVPIGIEENKKNDDSGRRHRPPGAKRRG